MGLEPPVECQEVVVFHALDKGQIADIVEIQLRDLQQRLAERRMALELTHAARERLAEAGFDAVYGARPVHWAIQQQVVQPLALRLLQGEFHDGDTVGVDVQHGQLIFQRHQAQEAGGPNGAGAPAATASS